MAQADWRQALWHLHHHWLMKLDRKGYLQFRPWKSNGDYLIECAPPKSAYPELAKLSSMYAHSIYGGGAVTASELDPFVEELRRHQL